jgi:GntR family transcriptional regulator, transcriptional repressor for pyruvate dehydrogenase complex
MSLQRVARRSLPDEVYDQLLTQVVDGEVEAGGSLPSERQLAEVLGVSRPAVREALQRLAHAGLVDVRQGDTTRVRDFRKFAGLDLLPRLLFGGGTVELTVVRSIMEARQLVGPKVAELAAERGGATLTPYLLAAIAALEATDDPVEKQRHALAFWEHVVDGADSITFRLMFNNLRAAYEPALAALATVLATEVEQVAAYRGVAQAIEAGNGSLARKRADALLRSGHDQLEAALDALKEK